MHHNWHHTVKKQKNKGYYATFSSTIGGGVTTDDTDCLTLFRISIYTPVDERIIHGTATIRPSPTGIIAIVEMTSASNKKPRIFQLWPRVSIQLSFTDCQPVIPLSITTYDVSDKRSMTIIPGIMSSIRPIAEKNITMIEAQNIRSIVRKSVLKCADDGACPAYIANAFFIIPIENIIESAVETILRNTDQIVPLSAM